jgi:hypothetical protein
MWSHRRELEADPAYKWMRLLGVVFVFSIVLLVGYSVSLREQDSTKGSSSEGYVSRGDRIVVIPIVQRSLATVWPREALIRERRILLILAGSSLPSNGRRSRICAPSGAASRRAILNPIIMILAYGAPLALVEFCCRKMAYRRSWQRF